MPSARYICRYPSAKSSPFCERSKKVALVAHTRSSYICPAQGGQSILQFSPEQGIHLRLLVSSKGIPMSRAALVLRQFWYRELQHNNNKYDQRLAQAKGKEKVQRERSLQCATYYIQRQQLCSANKTRHNLDASPVSSVHANSMLRSPYHQPFHLNSDLKPVFSLYKQTPSSPSAEPSTSMRG